jgi:4-amino-4-deoxychorismate lyase
MFCNGEPVDAALVSAALVNYGHFTSLQVRGGAVQGWALHMQRLQQGTRELFDATLDEGQLLDWLRQALQHGELVDASVRITVFARNFDFRRPLRAVPVDVLIAVSAPASRPALARSVLPLAYQRDLPHIKHIGTFPLFHHRRQAVQQGFDDAVFVDTAGRISEGSTWNIVFWDGAQVVWPQAAALRGTTEQLLVDGLQRQGERQLRREVMLDALAAFRGAAACNASGVWSLARIGDQHFGGSDELLLRLQQAQAHAAWQPL